jgi:predicted DNA-binding ribbon-helix-helix protein
VSVEARDRPSDATAEAGKAEFRVITHGDQRRGIRLERTFWQTIKDTARRRQLTIGQLVEEIARQNAGATNLASALRVACIGWLKSRTAQLEALTAAERIGPLLNAVPTAAFALGANRKILAFNTAFQDLVRRQFPMVGGSGQREELRMALDINVVELIGRLDANGNTPVRTGFAFGIGDRRFRGQINAVKAPSSDVDVVLAFVVG